MERTVIVASALNAKVHLLSGILIGAGALILMKQRCDQKAKKHNGSNGTHQSMPVADAKTD
jgi:hypothetical protein|tara:strand:- start:301 stop:483 length:183 start_codon:yes stop_codon:yes gene_type:complete